MYINKVLMRSKAPNVEPFRTARPARSNREAPQITIRGDNNLINLGSNGVVKVSTGTVAPSSVTPVRNGQWPQQLLDAIRAKAAKSRRSNEQICDLAGRVLGRAVVTLEKLTTGELARVYQAVCASEANA